MGLINKIIRTATNERNTERIGRAVTKLDTPANRAKVSRVSSKLKGPRRPA